MAFPDLPHMFAVSVILWRRNPRARTIPARRRRSWRGRECAAPYFDCKTNHPTCLFKEVKMEGRASCSAPSFEGFEVQHSQDKVEMARVGVRNRCARPELRRAPVRKRTYQAQIEARQRTAVKTLRRKMTLETARASHPAARKAPGETPPPPHETPPSPTVTKAPSAYSASLSRLIWVDGSKIWFGA